MSDETKMRRALESVARAERNGAGGETWRQFAERLQGLAMVGLVDYDAITRALANHDNIVLRPVSPPAPDPEPDR